MAFLYNIGCKLNQYEGYCLNEKYRAENVVIVNTCCVTHEAEIKSLKRFRQAKRLFPEHRIIVTGCLAQHCPELFAGAIVTDIATRNDLIEDILPSPNKSRYFLKIEDGCNQTCTFCVVSHLRTKIMSKPIEKIKQEIVWATSQNFREIVLVGANIGLYGLDINTSLVKLCQSLSEMHSLPRIRFSSLEPQFVKTELIMALKSIPLCRHFHIPVQSGDDMILSKMGRKYAREQIFEIFDLITKNFNDVAIGADIIVGFPGETDNEFENTLKLVSSSPLTHLHIFTYSPRQITPAYKLGDTVPPGKKKERLWTLKKLIAHKNYEFRNTLVNKTLEVIIEKKKNTMRGLTDNYIRISLDGECQERELNKIRITHTTEKETFGTLI